MRRIRMAGVVGGADITIGTMVDEVEPQAKTGRIAFPFGPIILRASQHVTFFSKKKVTKEALGGSESPPHPPTA